MEDNTATQKIFHLASETIEDFISWFAFQNHRALKAAKEDEQEKSSLLGTDLPRSVIHQIHQKMKPQKIEEWTYTKLVTALKPIYTTKKFDIGASIAFIMKKQRDGESIENQSRALNELGNQCEYKECCRSRLFRDNFLAG